VSGTPATRELFDKNGHVIGFRPKRHRRRRHRREAEQLVRAPDLTDRLTDRRFVSAKPAADADVRYTYTPRKDMKCL